MSIDNIKFKNQFRKGYTPEEREMLMQLDEKKKPVFESRLEKVKLLNQRRRG